MSDEMQVGKIEFGPHDSAPKVHTFTRTTDSSVVDPLAELAALRAQLAAATTRAEEAVAAHAERCEMADNRHMAELQAEADAWIARHDAEREMRQKLQRARDIFAADWVAAVDRADEAEAHLAATQQSYREARAMWPEGDTVEAMARVIRHERRRGDTYRARALALLNRSRSLKRWINLWKQEKQRAELLLVSRNEAWDKIEHLSRQNAEVQSQNRTAGDAIVALTRLMPFDELKATKAALTAAESRLAAAEAERERAVTEVEALRPALELAWRAINFDCPYCGYGAPSEGMHTDCVLADEIRAALSDRGTGTAAAGGGGE